MKLLDKMLHAFPERAGQQVVVLAQVLACDANVGYEDLANTQVIAVDGVRVHNLAALVDAVEGRTAAAAAAAAGGEGKKGKGARAAGGAGAGGANAPPGGAAALVPADALRDPGRYLRIDLEYNQVVVVDRREAAAANGAVLRQHGVAADRSPDLAAAAAARGGGGSGAGAARRRR